MFYTLSRKAKAEPMNRLNYNIFRGWTLPENEEGRDEGYRITDCNSKHIYWCQKMSLKEFQRQYYKLF